MTNDLDRELAWLAVHIDHHYRINIPDGYYDDRIKNKLMIWIWKQVIGSGSIDKFVADLKELAETQPCFQNENSFTRIFSELQIDGASSPLTSTSE